MKIRVLLDAHMNGVKHSAFYRLYFVLVLRVGRTIQSAVTRREALDILSQQIESSC